LRKRQLDSLWTALGAASSEEKVRGFLAVVLVAVLLALVFEAPSDRDQLVASTETLAIAVVAFYFGLHKGTPHRHAQTDGADGAQARGDVGSRSGSAPGADPTQP
jgi:hypothetical protein